MCSKNQLKLALALIYILKGFAAIDSNNNSDQRIVYKTEIDDPLDNDVPIDSDYCLKNKISSSSSEILEWGEYSNPSTDFVATNTSHQRSTRIIIM